MKVLRFSEGIKSCEFVELLIVHLAPLRSDLLVKEVLDACHGIEAGLTLELAFACVKDVLESL